MSFSYVRLNAEHYDDSTFVSRKGLIEKLELIPVTLNTIVESCDLYSFWLDPKRLVKMKASLSAICLADSFEFTTYHCMRLKAFRHNEQV